MLGILCSAAVHVKPLKKKVLKRDNVTLREPKKYAVYDKKKLFYHLLCQKSLQEAFTRHGTCEECLIKHLKEENKMAGENSVRKPTKSR